MKKKIPYGFFLQCYKPPDLGKKISTIWNVVKSEVYLTCINFWKFHDNLKTCLEVIRLQSWPENVKFSVKMQFFTFWTPWKICFWINDKFEMTFLKVGMKVFTFPKNRYFYLSFQTFTGTLKMLQITYFPQIQQENP